MNITFFGTGLMGSGFITRLIENGHQVTAWNRTPARTETAAKAGAKIAATPQAAVEGADYLHLSLSDDASVDSALEAARPGLAKTTWVIDHTTTAPTPTKARAEALLGAGYRFLHAPVFMAPANCYAGTGIMLLSGAAAARDAVQAHLSSMTGNVVYLGEAVDRAAAFKLFGNLTLIGMLGVLTDVNRLAHACGIGTDDAYSLFQQFNPGMMLPMRAQRISSGDFTASFELTMARKDVRLMIEEAARHGMELGVMPGVAALMDARIAKGDGAKDGSIIAQIG